MTLNPSLWNKPGAYDYFDELALDGLAWECLRRNAEYRRDYAAIAGNTPADTIAQHWGLRVLLNPETTARDNSVFWTPPLTSADILLSSVTVPANSPPLSIPVLPSGSDATGQFASVGSGPSELHLSFLDAPRPDAALCIVIPLDADMPDRIEAVRRLWQLMNSGAAPDQRLTRERRLRLRAMLRACDGRASGATVREIAQDLFGGDRIADELWSSSPLRYATLRLIRDGQHMIHGGYRDLLRGATAEKRRRSRGLPGVRT